MKFRSVCGTPKIERQIAFLLCGNAFKIPIVAIATLHFGHWIWKLDIYCGIVIVTSLG